MEYSETYDFSSGKKPCMAWFAKGECPKEDGCLLDHHDNLHPTKHQKAHADLVVENETGRSCDRCLLKMLKCDKVGRAAGGDDPCSECRWFAGNPGAQPCVLSKTNTVNDALCRMMLNAPSSAYMLPEQIHRLTPPKGKATKDGKPRAVKPAPAPMAAEDIKAGWDGKTKEELVDLPSWIPQDMREHPRAYLVPARESHNIAKAKAFVKENPDVRSMPSGSASNASLKRPLESASTSQGSRLLLPPPPFPCPATEPGRGECVTSTWDWRKSQWVMTYEDGTTVTLASQVSARQQRPMEQNRQGEKRRRIGPSQAQQTQQPAPTQSPAPAQQEDRMVLDQPNPPAAPTTGFEPRTQEASVALSGEIGYTSDSD
ncbi:hypothetical protein Q7P35_006125 [Cladosporium inversicolor]